nr:hypothetical protein [Microbacterium lemovicicum]
MTTAEHAHRIADEVRAASTPDHPEGPDRDAAEARMALDAELTSLVASIRR